CAYCPASVAIAAVRPDGSAGTTSARPCAGGGASAVDIGHHEVDAADDGDQIGEHVPAADRRNHLQMREGGGADACAIGHGVAVADEVVAVDTLRGLDAQARLAGRDDRAPGDAQEVGDQGLDVVHRALLDRRGSPRMSRHVVACRHVLEALPYDAQALAHLLHAHGDPVVAIPARAGWDVELELLVAAVGALLAIIPLQSRGTQPGAGYSPFERLLEAVLADADGANFEQAIAHHHALVLVEAAWQIADELAHHAVPALRQIGGDAADAKPPGVHAKAADRLDDLEHALAVR